MSLDRLSSSCRLLFGETGVVVLLSRVVVEEPAVLHVRGSLKEEVTREDIAAVETVRSVAHLWKGDVSKNGCSHWQLISIRVKVLRGLGRLVCIFWRHYFPIYNSFLPVRLALLMTYRAQSARRSQHDGAPCNIKRVSLSCRGHSVSDRA